MTAATYTVDAVAMLVYLVDGLPERADQLFAQAEAGETLLYAPGTALAEVLYSVSRDTDVRGITLRGTPEDAKRALLANGPVSFAALDADEITEYAAIVDGFGIHDAFVVASHRTRDTDAIVTTDGVIRDSGYDTIWE